MPKDIIRFIVVASLAALLISGCKTPSAPEQSSQAAAPVQQSAPAPDEKSTQAHAHYIPKPLGTASGSWSAPAPPPPRTPLSALREKWAANPLDRDADRTLFGIAKHELILGNLGPAAETLKRLQEKFPLSALYPESVFYLGLALQAAGRHDEAWIHLRSSLSRETSTARRALLEASLGILYEEHDESYPALITYARALRNDPEIFGKSLLIERVRVLAREIDLHRLREASRQFAETPAGPHMQTILARREPNEKPEQSEHTQASPQGKAKEPVSPPEVNSRRVGVMLPLSGAVGAVGGRVYDGIRLALRHSLAKHPRLHIRLAVRDTKSTARSAGNAVAVATELITQEKAVALIGPLLTEAAEASAEVANRLETPMLTPFALRMRMKPEFAWVFRNSLTAPLKAQGVAAYAVGHLGLRRFAVLHPANRGGVERTAAFTQAVESLGGEVFKVLSFPENATDFGAQMRALGGMDDRRLNKLKLSLGLKKTDPYELKLRFDALFVPARHEQAVLIAPQLPFYNMRSVKLLGGSGWNDPRLLEHGEHYVEGAVFVDEFFADSAEPVVMRFASEFGSIFGKKPDVFSALGYDAAQIVFSALASGAKSREDVRRYIASLRGFEGVTGLTDMGGDNNVRRQLFVLSVQERKIRHLQMVTPHRTFAGGAPIGENTRLSPAPTQ